MAMQNPSQITEPSNTEAKTRLATKILAERAIRRVTGRKDRNPLADQL